MDSAALLQAIAELGPSIREAARLAFVEGLGPEEIGRRQGISPALVRKRIQLARTRLLESLKPSGSSG